MTEWTARYLEPASVDEAVALLAEHGDEARVMAGGTALMVLMGQGLVEPGIVLGLRPRDGLAGLAGIERTMDGGLRVGALTTIRELERSAVAASVVPELVVAAHRIASVRIRNQATVGGHLVHADPAQDLPPLLLALDATIDVVGPSGGHSLPIGELALDELETSLATDELVTGLRIPPPRPAARVVTRAYRPFTAEDYPTVAVAVRIELAPDGLVEAARIALGAVAATAVRAPAAEAAMIGRSLTPATIEDAVGAIDPVLDPVGDRRGSAAYKRAMARVWTRRALLAARSQGAGVAVA